MQQGAHRMRRRVGRAGQAAGSEEGLLTTSVLCFHSSENATKGGRSERHALGADAMRRRRWRSPSDPTREAAAAGAGHGRESDAGDRRYEECCAA